MHNPIPELISDEDYTKPTALGFLHQTNLRNYLIHKEYYRLKADKVKQPQIVESLKKKYPLLAYDTFRKIVYRYFN